ncbi:MAG: Hsp70 family protein, partial [Clostridia bacterium]|nr:Hsp70 family protein [Clostridia bacterium]
SFDIDANGIVNVSAKDLGTGNQQQITITASSNLSDDEIDKAVREAEQYAAEDKARREAVEIRNRADQMVYECEKTIADLGDKIDANDKVRLETEIGNVKSALGGEDTQVINDATERMSQVAQEVFGKIYQQAGGDANAAGMGYDAGAGYDASYGAANQGGPVDAEYEVVDDNK